MSQERTDDEEIIQRMRYNEAKAYQIGHAFSPEMSASLREIDRLNATIAGYDELFERELRENKRLMDLVDEQVEIISGHNNGMALAKYLHKKDQEKIIDLTAKVQDRDERIEYLDSKIKELTQAWDAEKESVYFRSEIIRERDKEIERMRDSLSYAYEALGEAYDVAPDDSAVEGILFLAFKEVGEAIEGAE